MIVTTTQRTVAKLETHAFQPFWLTTILDDVDAGFLVESAEDIGYVNQAYAGLLGYARADELIGNHLSQVVAEEDAPRLLQYGRMRTKFEPAPRSYDFAARHRDDSAVPLHATVTASYIDRQVVITTLAQASIQPHRVDRGGDSAKPRPLLSPRETEVMEMILAGKPLKQIAFALDVSPKTVTTHRNRLLQKLHLHTNRDLFQYALHHHLVDWA